MSNKVSVLAYSRRLGSPVRKAVMVYFAERASDNGEGVWASKSSIAAAVECGRSTVIRTINDFVEEGLLRVVGERRCRTGATIEYAINLDVLASLEAVSTHETRPAAGPVPERDPSQSGTAPVPERDPYPSRSGTQTIMGTTIEPSEYISARETRDEIQPINSVSLAVSEYNSAAERTGWPKVQKVTPARRTAVKARLTDAGGIDGWRHALGRAESSDFLSGRSGRWRGCSFDWLTKQANFTKLMEGNYDNRDSSNTGTGSHRDDPALQQIARLAGIVEAPGNGRC